MRCLRRIEMMWRVVEKWRWKLRCWRVQSAWEAKCVEWITWLELYEREEGVEGMEDTEMSDMRVQRPEIEPQS